MTGDHSPIRIVVIGGGIAGLSAAHRLVELRDEKKFPLDMTLFEAGDHLGGVIRTMKQNGFLIEAGPENFITTKPAALALCRRIGLTDQLLPTNEEHRRALVVHRGKLHPVPEGFLMLAPTQFLPFAMSPLFSWRGKLRMAMELFLPAKKHNDDESLASFVTRRLGREAFERVAQPLVSGIYTADAYTLSLRTTMPRFLQMEEQHGSIIKAMWCERRAAARARKERSGGTGSRGGDSGARYSIFVSFKNGLQTLVDALAARLPAGTVRINQRVARIAPAPGDTEEDGKPHLLYITLENGTRLEADGVIITGPAHHAAALVENFDTALAAQLSTIQYASSVVVSVAYRQSDVSHPLDGFGFVIPEVEKRSIIASSFSSVKFPGRAPEGHVLLRCFIGGAIRPDAYEWDDDRMVTAVRQEMKDLLGIEKKPLFTLVHRHYKSMPQYPVGHLKHIARIKEQLARHPGLLLAGNAYGGIGIPDCVQSGEEAANNLVVALMVRITV